jgi:hypothetical protein
MLTASQRIIAARNVVDIEITAHGSIYLFTPRTQAGREFVAEAEDHAQFWGLSLVVEHGYVNDVCIEADSRGLRLA